MKICKKTGNPYYGFTIGSFDKGIYWTFRYQPGTWFTFVTEIRYNSGILFSYYKL